MSYDLEILVERRKHLKDAVIGNIRIEVTQSKGRSRYYGSFDYMAEKSGSWCTLFSTDIEERYLSGYWIADIKTVEKLEICYPFWMDINYTMFVFTIKDEYRISFEEFMKHLITCSPIKRIMFLPRLQGNEYNNVCGVITLEQFFNLLYSGKILFNISYIIQNGQMQK